ncbi:unnamed protein product, partial [Cylicostephanus goldi]
MQISSFDGVEKAFSIPEGDLITLSDDSDLLLALQSEQNLKIDVSLDSKAIAELTDIQQQVVQIQDDIQRLLKSVAGLHIPSTHAASQSITSQHFEPNEVLPAVSNQGDVPPLPVNGFDATPHSPPSPVPSEKPELPATIQPSLQEQVLPDGLARHDVAPCVEEIPLEAGAPTAFAPPPSEFAPPPMMPPAVQDPHGPPPTQQQQQQGQQQQAFAPPPPSIPSIPSFPQANMPPQGHFSPSHPPHEQTPPQPPQQFVPPQQHGAPPQMPPSQFAPPPQQQSFAPPPQQQQFAPPPQQFAPPPQAPPQPQPPTPQSSVS